jgi:tetratricopeptide (TPR) repeat protein
MLLRLFTNCLTRFAMIFLLLLFSLHSNSQENDSLKARVFYDSAWKAFKAYYFKKSIRLLDSVIYYRPSFRPAYDLKAEALLSLGEYAEAARTYKIVVGFGDDRLLKVSANVFLGMLYAKAGMNVEASVQYTSAVSLWESGYQPDKNFRNVEELDYFLALAFLQQKRKVLDIIDGYNYDSLSHPRRIEITTLHQTCLPWFEKTPKELLDDKFKIHMLPEGIKALEE